MKHQGLLYLKWIKHMFKTVNPSEYCVFFGLLLIINKHKYHLEKMLEY